MERVEELFGEAMRAAYMAHGFKSLKHAEYRTGISHTEIHRMCKGRVPSKALVTLWAVAIGEPVNHWLALAGYPPLSDGGISPAQTQLQLSPPVPSPVLSAIAEAPTREEKVQIAFEYLRRPELGLRMGATNMHSLPTEAKLAIIRVYEATTGVQLLPPEVV